MGELSSIYIDIYIYIDTWVNGGILGVQTIAHAKYVC